MERINPVLLPSFHTKKAAKKWGCFPEIQPKENSGGKTPCCPSWGAYGARDRAGRLGCQVHCRVELHLEFIFSAAVRR